MNCPKCNHPVSEGSVFCESCGARLVEDTATQAVQNATPAPQAPAPKKGLSKNALIGIIAAAAVVVVGIIAAVFFLNRTTEINLSKYVKINYEGYDTLGKAELEFDEDAMFDEYKSKLDTLDAYSLVTRNLDYKLDKDEELSNGDKVKVVFKFNNDAVKKLGIKFTSENKEYTVSGLKEVKEVDPFADIKLDVTGVSPRLSVKVINNSEDEVVKDIYFSANDSYGLKKGDTVTVSFSNDDDYYLEHYGYKFTSTSKDFKLDKVNEYVSKFADISEKAMEKYKKQVKSVVKAYLVRNKSYYKSSDLNFEGCYFLHKKDDYNDGYGTQNKLYIVFSTTLSKKKGSYYKFKPTKAYFTSKLSDIIKNADGSMEVEYKSTWTEGSTSIKNGPYISGYTKVSDMKDDLVRGDKAEFNAEATGKLKK